MLFFSDIEHIPELVDLKIPELVDKVRYKTEYLHYYTTKYFIGRITLFFGNI